MACAASFCQVFVKNRRNAIFYLPLRPLDVGAKPLINLLNLGLKKIFVFLSVFLKKAFDSFIWPTYTQLTSNNGSSVTQLASDRGLSRLPSKILILIEVGHT
jgi:hypothetical protein